MKRTQASISGLEELRRSPLIQGLPGASCESSIAHRHPDTPRRTLDSEADMLLLARDEEIEDPAILNQIC